MDLRKSYSKFASHELQKWNWATSAFEPTGVKGSLQVYDRFISDRDFGQKKRIFLCPGEFDLDRNLAVLQIPGVEGVWLIEGENADADASGVYGTPVVLREARYTVKLYKKGGSKKRASGVGYTDQADVLMGTTWGDFSRYSSTGSRELPAVDYTIGS